MKQKLITVFEPEQAKVLSEVISESYNDSVKTSDFNELKSVVSDLAEAMKSTQIQVSNLAEAQKCTEIKLEELAEAQKRTEIKVEELAGAQKDLAESQKRTEKALQNLARQVGGLSEAFGGSLEDFAIDLVPEILENNWNLKVEDAGRDEFTITKKTVEMDLVIRGSIEGKPIVVLGEVKSNLTPFEVEKFLKVTGEVIQHNPDEFAGREVRLIFFGYRASREARELVKKEGMYMIFTHGKIL